MNNRTILENTALKSQVESLTSQLKAVHQQLASCEGERARVWTVGDDVKERAESFANLRADQLEAGGVLGTSRRNAVEDIRSGYLAASAHDAQRIAELESSLAAKDHAIHEALMMIDEKEAELIEMKRLVNHLSDEADGWKGRATGHE